MILVPVVSSVGKPLMPCHPARARQLVRAGKAVRRFNKGIFYIKLTQRADGDTQDIAVGIDPGSKKEGFTLKSKAHTYLNIQTDAVGHVSKAVEVRRNMRRTRRNRKTPCRKPRFNRSRGGLPPSTKARWQWKLRIARWLSKLFPISTFVVEDIKAATRKGKRRWNRSFSPLEVGKQWFYEELSKSAPVDIRQGHETAKMRDALGLKKTSAKLSNKFEAHCVDSWVLANDVVRGHEQPDNTRMMLITPLMFRRRQLQMLKPAKGGIRKAYGGTRSCGFKRGSLVKHSKWGLTYVGGTSKGRVSLHSLETGARLCRNAKPLDIEFLAFNSWRSRLLPCLKAGVPAC